METPDARCAAPVNQAVWVLMIAVGTVCGEALALTAGRLALKTRQGRVTVDLVAARGITVVGTCPPVFR
jgi:hypothetical protein